MKTFIGILLTISLLSGILIGKKLTAKNCSIKILNNDKRHIKILAETMGVI